MELVNVARVLLRHRVALLLGVFAAVAAGLAGAGAFGAPRAGEGKETGQALVRVLVDTPKSLTSTAEIPGAGTIQPRTVLFGDELATDAMTAAIAHRAGLRPSEVAVIGPASQDPPVTLGLAQRTAAAAVTAPALVQRHVVTAAIQVDAPVIWLRTFAPTRREAEALARAATAALRSSADARRDGRFGVRAEQLGPIRSRSVAASAGPGKALGIVAAVAVFAFWCTAIVLASGLRRLWQSAAMKAGVAG